MALLIPLLATVALVGGLFLKSFNDARVERHLTVWQAIQTWQADSQAEDARLTPAQRERLQNNRAGWLAIGPLVLCGAAAYFLPTAIAIGRKHPQTAAIIALNIFLGWSILGWVAGIVWALVKTPPAKLEGALSSS